MTTLLEKLNPRQREAAATAEGRLLILAGAGSGKTQVLTTRMAYMVEALRIPPKSILGLTFTNKAASEMRERVAALISQKAAKEITLATFHSFCMALLREEIHHLGFTSNFSLYDEKDLERLVKLIARDILDCEKELPSLKATLEMISFANQRGINPHAPSGKSWHDTFAGDVHTRLKDSLRAYNAVDFDHLLTLTVELFTKFPDVLSRYQDRYRYIMIDEYQDTNPIQFQLADLLAKKYQNLCVVGDDDQAIYGWRGAEVKNILEFDGAKKITLEQNYRSSNLILQAANAVISNNRSRHAKKLWSDKGAGEKIETFVAPGELEEAEAVVCRIAKMHEKEHIPWSNIAILYRSNALARPFELALMKQRWRQGGEYKVGIPYQVFGGQEFYERKEVKDLLAYLRVIINPLDEEAILRIINLPRRGIGEAFLDKITSIARKEKKSLFSLLEQVAKGDPSFQETVSLKAKASLSHFIEAIHEAKQGFQNKDFANTVLALCDKVSFKKSIEEDVKSDKMQKFKWENIEAFVNSLKAYQEKNPEGTLSDFVGSMTLDLEASAFKSRQGQENGVNLMTFHSAKGLEFEACFLIGLEDHLIPHEKSLNDRGLEEERRLMYVAITRAKRKLCLSMTKKRKRMGKDLSSIPSRFLLEIPEELIEPRLWHEV